MKFQPSTDTLPAGDVEIIGPVSLIEAPDPSLGRLLEVRYIVSGLYAWAYETELTP